MKNILTITAIALGLIQTTQAQVGCDMMNLIVNVGSDSNMVNIYHPGGYLTWPSEFNVIAWEVTDAQGNAVAAETLVNENFFQFSHNVPVTDIMNVSALLTNDSAGVACLIEDQLYWELVEVIPGSYYGTWAFVHNNVGVDVTGTLGIDDLTPSYILDNKMYDLLGRELQVAPIGQMYIQNKKRYIQFH
ncbi:MAG: hypothetical protein ACKVJH_05865 [Flavobacteriales bacterium]